MDGGSNWGYSLQARSPAMRFPLRLKQTCRAASIFNFELFPSSAVAHSLSCHPGIHPSMYFGRNPAEDQSQAYFPPC